jgi:hypothetical protein
MQTSLQQLTDERIDLIRFGWGRADPTYRQALVARLLPEATQDQWRAFDEPQSRSTSAAPGRSSSAASARTAGAGIRRG